MNNRALIIRTTQGRALTQPAMIILDNPGPLGSLERLLGDATVTRLLGALLAGSLFGSAMHHLLGVGTALVLTFLLVPLVAGALTLHLSSGKDEAEKLRGLQQAAKAFICSPLVILSGSLFGVLSLLFWGAATTALCGFLNRAAA